MKKLILLLFFVFGSINAQFNPAQFYNYGKRINVVLPLLDSYSGAKVAFSLRKLRTAYSGNCVRVRRSSDNAEQDIGFKIDGTIDDTSLLSFVGANDGFITTWYDQSGNSLDAVQTTNANQPRIVLAGVIENDLGYYVIRFDQTLSHFMKVGLFSFTEASVFSYGKYLTGNNNARLFGMSPVGAVDSGSTSPCFTFSTTTIRSNARAINTLTGAGQISDCLIAQMVTTTQAEMYRDNVLVGSDYTITSSLCNPPAINIGRTGDLGFAGNSTDYMNGYLKELVFYDSDQNSNRSGIETNIKAYYNL